LATAPRQPPAAAQLVLFTQSADTHFVRTTLPQLRALAQRTGLELIERAARTGVPSQVTATPALFLRNHNGYGQFGGRYTDFAAIENFIRINRLYPKAPASDLRRAVLLQERKSQRIVVPLKVTPQQGSYRGASPFWLAAVRRAVTALPAFSTASEVALWPTDRRFYLDVHPYVDGAGTVFLSAAIFSQFDCIHPVWDNFSAPLRGAVDRADELLARLAARLQQVIQDRLQRYDQGDALTPLAAPAALWDWDQLPPPPAVTAPGSGGVVDLLRSDRYADPRPVLADVPMLQFNFPAPLDRYAGEVRQLDGWLALDTVAYQLSGAFTARVRSLTMGMAELDAKVLKSYLRVRKYPKASFRFADVQLPPGYDGQQSLELLVPGTFTMIGQDHPVSVRTRLEPTVGQNGQPLVAVFATFQLDIADPFGLTGPDGPADLRNRLDFQLHFLLAG
jgi:hypothetical protein